MLDIPLEALLQFIHPHTTDPSTPRQPLSPRSSICFENQKEDFAQALKTAVPQNQLKSLYPHEREMMTRGLLHNITHHGSSSIWLEGSLEECEEGKTFLYRPMGDLEVAFLLKNNQLPATQPYQAVIEGPPGRAYAIKYLTGQKTTNTKPSTVVEFKVPTTLVELLKARQYKVEDGAISMGLGDKAGKGLPWFNECLEKGQSTWRIVKVKRAIKKKEK